MVIDFSIHSEIGGDLHPAPIIMPTFPVTVVTSYNYYER